MYRIALAMVIGAVLTALHSPQTALAADEADAETNQEFLARLQTRETQFDNVHLVVITKSKLPEELLEPTADAGIAQAADAGITLAETPQNARIVYRCESTIRGAEWTNRGEVIEAPEGVAANMAMSVAEGKLTMLVIDKETFAQGSASIQKLTPELETTVGESLCMMKFALGFGFGRHIREIERLEADGEGHTLTATMDIEPHAHCTLSLDSDLVVRHATIDLAERRIEVATKGAKLVDGFLFAETGRVRISYEKTSIEEESFIIFQEAQFHLSDERYKELATLEIPKDAIVTNLDDQQAWLQQSQPQQAQPQQALPPQEAQPAQPAGP